MRIKTLSIIGVLAILTGCASQPPIILDYSPSSTVSVQGEIEVGNFNYLPGQNNSSVRANQIRSTALCKVLTDKSIDEYFESAIIIESNFSGLKVKESQNKLTGDVIEFLIDDLGYDIDWTMEVNYILTKADGNACYDKNHKIEKQTAKFTNTYGTLNEIVRLNIEKVFKDPDFAKCIANKS